MPGRATPTRPLAHANRRTGRCGIAGIAFAAGLGPGLPVRAAPSSEPEIARDPNERPRMPAPYGQFPEAGQRWDPDFGLGHSRRRKLALTLSPVFAVFRLPFRGRPNRQPRSPGAPALRGGGAEIELDIQLWRPLNLRLWGSYSGHPVPDEFVRNDQDELVQVAARGTIHAPAVGVGVAYAMDLGRVLPLLEVGLGGLWIRPPGRDDAGSLGGACIDGATCDVGLRCAPDNTCRQATELHVYAGLGVDIMLRDRWSLGAWVRYFALLSDPSVFPVYLQAGARCTVRF